MTEQNKNQQTGLQHPGVHAAENKKNHTSEKRGSRRPSKAFIGVTCALLGIAGTLAVQNIVQSRADPFRLHRMSFFGDEFIEKDGSFKQIVAVAGGMEDALIDHQEHLKEIFGEAREDGVDINRSALSRTEDADNYIYELKFSGFKKEDVVASVRNGVVTFSAEKKAGEKAGFGGENQAASPSSKFHYSFPTPQYDVKKEPEIIRKDDTIVVKLSKRK